MPRMRLHKSSIAIGAFIFVALTLISLPGQIYDWDVGSTLKFEHGWPFIYLRREISDLGPPPGPWSFADVPWLYPDAWKFWQSDSESNYSRWKFSGAFLATDFAILSALLVAIVAAAENRRRKRSSILSVSLADIFLLITAVGCALGWMVHLRVGHKQELAAYAALAEGENAEFVATGHRWQHISCAPQVCSAPVWFVSLFGSGWMPEFMWRTDSVDSFGEVSAVDALCNTMNALPCAKSLLISSINPRGANYPFAKLQSIRRLETLTIYPRLGEDDVPQLSQLKGLKELAIIKSSVDPRLVQQLELEMPGCKISDAMDKEKW